MSDEDNILGGSLVLEFRRHVQTKNFSTFCISTMLQM